MLLGPVFRAELLRTSRRRRYYVLRMLYGLMLLFLIWLGFEGTFAANSAATIDEVAEFAQETFTMFAVVQLVTILLLIPALFGGAIADEKQRKTLHYLMASQLSSFEIVVDKVLGRAPHLVVFLALGLPVVSLLGLFGGVVPEYVAVAYAGTISSATLAVAMTVLVSTVVRKVRQAVLIAYILLLGWQFVPPLIWGLGSRIFPITYAWIAGINEWACAATPLGVLIRTSGFGPTSSAWVFQQVAWMVGLQIGGAALLVVVAVWQLRPAFRRHEATQPRRKWFGERKGSRTRSRRWWDRPACGSDAMAWKERHFVRTDVLTRLVVLPATVFVSTLLILIVGVDETISRAIVDLWHQGYQGLWARDQFVDHLRVVSVWYVAIGLLAVAGASASSVAVEREEDTWVSLTSTPLTGWEILRGKVLGALWAQRGFLAIPVGLWVIGLVTGSLHPMAFLVALLALGLVTWLVAAVGIHASLKASSTSKALVSTIATLALLYGYPVFLLRMFLGENLWNQYTPFVGLPARLAVGPLVSYRSVAESWDTVRGPGFSYLPARDAITLGLGLAAFYAAVAGVLTLRSVGRFDRWLDRPRLSGAGRAIPVPVPIRAGGASEPALVQS